MAQVRGGIERALLKYPDLDLSTVRLIGWGAGQVFTDYYPLLGLPVEYTVCPFTHAEGKYIHGVPVRSPEHLMKEPHDQVLVVIFSGAAPEIMQQIHSGCGDYRVVCAVDHGYGACPTLAEVQELAPLVNGGLSFDKPRLDKRPKLGIFMQGPAFDFTPLGLAHTRMKYPAAHLGFVTWNNQDPQKIERCRPWVDEIILLDPPVKKVGGYVNHITRSCMAGAQHMLDQGVEYVVRMRSDAILTGSIYQALDRLYADGEKNSGKIGIFLGASWTYIPFHFSDKFMVARAHDMKELWSLPELEDRPEDEAPTVTLVSDHHFLELRRLSFESRLWGHYATRHGYPVETLEHAYKFARDRLIPLEPDLSMFSLKHLPLFNLKLINRLTPSIEWWEEMNTDWEGTVSHLNSLGHSHWTARDFMRNKVG